MNETYQQTLDWELSMPVDDTDCQRCVLFFAQGNPVVPPDQRWSAVSETFDPRSEDALFVAKRGATLWYARALNDVPAGWQMITLRTLASMDAEQFALASRAVQLLQWRDNHRYCGACGNLTQSVDYEHVRLCPQCHHSFYPKISPCVIVLVTQGDRVLLARSKRHAHTQMFSLIAGFVEVGETLEQAVHREVWEEVGVQVSTPLYQGSQTWPFPAQLMLGFVAAYDQGDIRIQEDELIEAGWYSVRQLPQVPNKLSIAGWLIRRFVAEQGLDPEQFVKA